MLILFPFGMLLAIPASYLFRLMNRAGTLIVVARKPDRSEGDAQGAPEGKSEQE